MSRSQGKQIIHVTLMLDANFELNTSSCIYAHIIFEIVNDPIIDIHIDERCINILDKGITCNSYCIRIHLPRILAHSFSILQLGARAHDIL